MVWRIIYKTINNLAKDTILEQHEENTFLEALLCVPTEPPWNTMSFQKAEQLFCTVNRVVIAHKGNEMVVIEWIPPIPPIPPIPTQV